MAVDREEGQTNLQPGPAGGKKESQSYIEYLRPLSAQHEFVLQYVRKRIAFSQQKMSAFYPRWRNSEHLMQAYISLPDYEKRMDSIRSTKKAPEFETTINVPFAWAQVNTIVTYLLHMFAGRKPMFTVGSNRAEQVKRAKNLETLLQYNGDVKRFARSLYFFLMDGETYGVSIMRSLWTQQNKKRTVIVPPTAEFASLMGALGQTAQGTKQTETYVSFEGNTCDNIDPFMFFPDPRVPMHEVNEKGEWVAWRAFEGRHRLIKAEQDGQLMWVTETQAQQRDLFGSNNDSARGIRALGESQAGAYNDMGRGVAANYQVDQGSFEASERDLGLGDSKEIKKWLITMLNNSQIVQCEPIEVPHDRHPVIVAEPNSVGYAFGQLGTVDLLGPMQQLMGWFMTSHVENVRTALNNMLVVDPSKVEMADLQRPGPGKIIRLKNNAFGLSDPKSAVYQLPVADVTGGHMGDSQNFARMAMDLTGVSDNMRGLQDAGGRKTATEIRTVSDAGSSRLAAKGKIYSFMALSQIAEMWSANYQQYMSMEFESAVLGAEGQADPVIISPESIQGDFYFPVHDGTLPIDKIGLLDVWKEIFQAVLQDPQLRQTHDVVSMFDWICQLGGAQNISSFKLQTVSQDQQMNDLSRGAMPIGALPGMA